MATQKSNLKKRKNPSRPLKVQSDHHANRKKRKLNNGCAVNTIEELQNENAKYKDEILMSMNTINKLRIENYALKTNEQIYKDKIMKCKEEKKQQQKKERKKRACLRQIHKQKENQLKEQIEVLEYKISAFQKQLEEKDYSKAMTHYHYITQGR
eukprot:437255_1